MPLVQSFSDAISAGINTVFGAEIAGGSTVTTATGNRSDFTVDGGISPTDQYIQVVAGFQQALLDLSAVAPPRAITVTQQFHATTNSYSVTVSC